MDVTRKYRADGTHHRQPSGARSPDPNHSNGRAPANAGALLHDPGRPTHTSPNAPRPGLRDQDGSADGLGTAIVVVVEHEARRHLTREALSADKPPGRLAIVEAIVAGCGGGEDDLRRFASAWRKLAMKDRATATVVQPAPADSPGRGRLGECPASQRRQLISPALPVSAAPTVRYGVITAVTTGLGGAGPATVAGPAPPLLCAARIHRPGRSATRHPPGDG